MGIRSLSIDWPLDHPQLHADGFFGRTSLCAYDTVFVDPASIARHWTEDVPPSGDGVRRTDPHRDRGFGKTMTAWMGRRREEAEDLLRRGGGLLICRLRTRGEPLEIAPAGAPAEHVDRASWLPSVSLVDRHHQLTFPANGRFVARQGRDVVFAGSGSPFEDYLRTFEGQIVYDAVYQDLLSTPIDRFATVLARNRVGDVLALEIPYDDGRLILVPPLEGVSPTREAAVLMEAVRQATVRPTFVSLPDWLPSYPLPGEDALTDELVGLAERRDKLIAKIDEVQTKLQEKTRIKQALYAKGRFTFLPAVAEAFSLIGFEVESEGEGLRLRSAEGDAFVVAEASEGAQIGLPAYRRLRDAVDQTVTDGDGHHKGILVVNGSRELDPRRRPTPFSAEVLRGCQAQGFCILSSYHLFKLAERAMSDRGKKTLVALRRNVLEADGEFREADGK